MSMQNEVTRELERIREQDLDFQEDVRERLFELTGRAIAHELLLATLFQELGRMSDDSSTVERLKRLIDDVGNTEMREDDARGIRGELRSHFLETSALAGGARLACDEVLEHLVHSRR